MDPDQPTEIGFLEDTEILHDAEDVKTVRLAGGRGTVDVRVTDESMLQLLTAAETVFEEIHADMAALRDRFDEFDEFDEGHA